MSRRRTVDYKTLATYTLAHPEQTQGELARHFDLSQSRVSQILTHHGIHRHRGRPPKSPDNWEHKLHDMGLGMDRGLNVFGRPIIYGWSYRDRVADY
jgi:hypothetical protein